MVAHVLSGVKDKNLKMRARNNSGMDSIREELNEQVNKLHLK